MNQKNLIIGIVIALIIFVALKYLLCYTAYKLQNSESTTSGYATILGW